VDLKWRNAVMVPALVWLFKQAPKVGKALWRAQLLGTTRLHDGTLAMKFLVANEQDRIVLASATRSWTGSDMPGALDLAFEKALPEGEWPVFAFEVARREANGGVA
jgi:hypothetical protein